MISHFLIIRIIQNSRENAVVIKPMKLLNNIISKIEMREEVTLLAKSFNKYNRNINMLSNILISFNIDFFCL